MKNFAVVLTGCGHLDGTEIREAVSTLIALDVLDVSFQCFAPNIDFVAVDHITKHHLDNRNIMHEAARIARGNILDLNILKVNDFDGIIIPGGYGAVKNISNFIEVGKDANVLHTMHDLITKFFEKNKIIAAICIAPVIVALTLGKKVSLMLTLGDESNAEMINSLNCKHIVCKTEDFVKDNIHNVFSTPAYMRNDRLSLIYKGIFNMIEAMVNV